MDRALYTAASNMLAQQRALDAAANNVANVNTVGYRRAIPVLRGFHLVFADQVQRSPGHRFPGVPGGGATLEATYRDTQQGDIRPTGRPLDVALDGPGYFTLQTPHGLRYTRAGNFQASARRELVTADGDLVLGLAGPIPVQGGDISVDEEGIVRVDGAAIDRLRVVEFLDDQSLIPAGNAQFLAPPDAERTQLDATDTRVLGGHLENPNLNVVEELVQVIATQRSYELATRAIRTIDRTLGAAVQDIAAPA